MSAIGSLLEAASIVIGFPTIIWIFLGIALGMILGAIPGIGAAIGIAILLPLSIAMDGSLAIIFFVCMYLGGMYGGSISAVLINTPGTAAAAATTLDGYPLSKQGLAVNALTLSALASAIGGMIAITILIAISPFLTTILLRFGSPEYFMVAVLGLSMITVIARGSMAKGLMMGAFGLLISTVGLSNVGGAVRYDMGLRLLFDGIHFVAVLIGLFAVTEMIKLASREGGISEEDSEMTGSRRDGIIGVVTRPVTVLKSAVIGLGIGAIPGAGASVSNFVAYGEAMRADDDPDSFGEGNERGVIAAEAANSATVAGSLIPTLSFGIPGSGTTAVLLGALLMHGFRPGPTLFTEEAVTTYSFFVSLVIGNIIIAILGLAVIAYAGYVTKISTDYIVPVIIPLAIFGGFAMRETMLDVITVVLFGILGYYMVKHDFSIIALVLGVVLGPVAETNLHRSLQIADGSYLIFIRNPISLLMVIATVVIIVGPLAKVQYQKFRGADTA
ncbi:hypothetical protein CP556_22345 [Natrinema sp. CBA1119]|uniref:tripartite tricarboxylate transporter permease n=1 Tax=Natrinema sp. CBA1119 TaxID=1608465 RepID=UPI000BF921E8|nr:tripartite tricarboxylate transporter permease [Natrinema sp. CBA1119]PGF13846.1 hypothetical protein CP556_22345 [Natrinema sp. CBA1119]